MFTGIIREVGVVDSFAAGTVRISHKIVLSAGDSLAVNGVCLTVKNDSSFDVMEETLKRTNLRLLKKGVKVNLEPAVAANGKIDGHFVSGHVDFVAEVLSLNKGVLRVRFPLEYSKFFAIKGSVAINGVSLTISALGEDYFEVSLVSFTLKNTNLGEVAKNDKVNVEVDMIARYLNRLLEAQAGQTKYERSFAYAKQT
ncbi:MAG: riboflavin synthase subunit alpha [uncultured bacterium]|nr:MAG: riboflavin synthase subunit alpha [uncultured bacterium]OGJ47247.1 MAG: riboflavin synthase subunit alpha [Candidatus Peregrinibacteria bacterium RIFOXYA2_FULL_41_18]OGJ52939.1 MAG: riboflavin synthase subunit alpha [Candidatus Peregrinibacteria bacterium RIFOXYB2_FULL_41_88]OGJ53497.1 MAG: riboflavin synthase subunit alpha [Candidatus Peregrinibacteria bacterium RIFOXYC2_FULL_41_22]